MLFIVAASCKYFRTVLIKNHASVGLAGPYALIKALLGETHWHESEEGDTIACWMPKIFSLFFGTKMIYGSLIDDSVLSDFSSLREGYDVYAGQVCAAVTPINKAN